MSILSSLAGAASAIGSFISSNASTILGVGGKLLGGFLGNSQSFNMSSALSQDQFNYNKYLMQHRHQFEVDDLLKAGLNPILSAGGSGAAGSTGSATLTSSDFTNALSSAIELDNNLKNSSAQRNLLKAQRDKVLSDAMKTEVSTAIDAERLKQEKLKTDYILRDPTYFTPKRDFSDITREYLWRYLDKRSNGGTIINIGSGKGLYVPKGKRFYPIPVLNPDLGKKSSAIDLERR